jgi:hypothetical protein
MSETMRLDGEMNIYFLKTRSSKGVGHMSMLSYNPNNLQIGDHKNGTSISVMPKGRKNTPTVKEIMNDINPQTRVTADITGLPGIPEETYVKEVPEHLFQPEPTSESRVKPMIKSSGGGESLLALMDSLRGNL